MLKAVRGMCVAQLLTGLVLLLSGWISLHNISAYHWQLIVYFAWFANVTHVCCLVVLRGYFHQNPGDRGWRLVLMTILWVGLIVAMGPTFWFNWIAEPIEESASRPASNARCFYTASIAQHMFAERACENLQAEYQFRLQNDLLGKLDAQTCTGLKVQDTQAFSTALLSILLAIFSFPSRMIKLTKTSSNFTKHVVRGKGSRWITRRISSLLGRGSYDVASLMISLYFFGKISADILSSELSDVSYHTFHRHSLLRM